MRAVLLAPLLLAVVVLATLFVGAEAKQLLSVPRKHHNARGRITNQFASSAHRRASPAPQSIDELVSVLRADRATPPGSVPNPTQPSNPVIAIVSTPYEDCAGFMPLTNITTNNPHSCIENYYVKWLEFSGVRVIPMPWDGDFNTVKKPLLDGINGVLFPGGGLGGAQFTRYVQYATEIYNYAQTRTQQNDNFVLWGTCQGFQVLSIVQAGGDQSILHCDYVGTDPSMLPLDFTANQPSSRMFGSVAQSPIDVVKVLRTSNSTLNYHSCGITPSVFEQKVSVATMLSTNVDVNGSPFVSSYENKNMNLFATQYHPERPPFEFSENIITHDPHTTLTVSTFHSQFLANKLRTVQHSFVDQNTVNKLAVENYEFINLGWGAQGFWLPF